MPGCSLGYDCPYNIDFEDDEPVECNDCQYWEDDEDE